WRGGRQESSIGWLPDDSLLRSRSCSGGRRQRKSRAGVDLLRGVLVCWCADLLREPLSQIRRSRLNHGEMFERFGIEHAMVLADGACPRPDECVHITFANLTDMTKQRGDFFVDGCRNVYPVVGMLGGEEINVADAMVAHVLVELFRIIHRHAGIGD